MCGRKRRNAYSDVAIVGKQESEVIGHVPEKLATLVTLSKYTLLVSHACISAP